MINILSVEDIRKRLHADYTRSVLNESKGRREENISSFIEIDRNNLKYQKTERRLQLYKTLMNEKICIQFPGKESAEKPGKPYDFRPKLIMSSGEIMQDASFGFIWDLLEGISQRHKDYLCLVATVFWYLGYMYNYSKVKDYYLVEDIKFDQRRKRQENIVNTDKVALEWWRLDLDDTLWGSLNNYIGEIKINDEKSISFEALIKFIDLLLQNEDCKYYYLKKMRDKKNYRFENGRTKTADANLAIILYFEGKCTFSEIANRIQRGKGLPSLNKSDYPIVTDNIITIRAN